MKHTAMIFGAARATRYICVLTQYAANSLKVLKDLKLQSLKASLPVQESPTNGALKEFSSHQFRVAVNGSIQLLSMASEKVAWSGRWDLAVLESVR